MRMELVAYRLERDHEEISWIKVVLGESNLDQLRYTLFFLIRSRFGFCGCKEHFNLRMYSNSQINIIKVNDIDSSIYKEFSSKTRQGGIKDRDMKALVVRYAFCYGFCLHCFIEIYKKYMRPGPHGNKSWPKYYV